MRGHIIEGTSAIVGASLHNGWGIFVTVCVSDGVPIVVDRRRLELIERGVPKQPYHHEALELDLAEAANLIERVRASAVATAREAMAALRGEFEKTQEILGIALPERTAIPNELSDILIRGKALYIADRELYVTSVGEAARSLSLDVWTYPRKREFSYAAEATGIDGELLRTYVGSWGKVVGAPWRKDHQTAAATAIGVLSTIGMLQSGIHDWCAALLPLRLN